MINLNGNLQEAPEFLLNRGLLYGDAVFETNVFHQGVFHFSEDHYFRLMAGMRMMRMEIPPYFTESFWLEEMSKLITDNEKQGSLRFRTTVIRVSEGKYTPKSPTGDIMFIIQKESIEHFRGFIQNDYVVDLFPDFYISKNELNTIKSNNKAIYVIAGIWAKENGYHNALLINSDKKLVEAVGYNIFIINKDDSISTPPISDGCLRGVYRKNLLKQMKNWGYEVKEESISPFSLQQAKELFLTNSVQGIQPVHQYRNTSFESNIALELREKMIAIH